ncbi:hypothetical protein [Ekhidna sp.]|uniref:hypothetical protein n=1 Tax=Ekhidna sp. TaxID=2608089 RepID=UPI00329A2080
MRTFLVIVLALIINDPKEIAKINALKKEAEKAYHEKDYELALSKYTLLHDSLGVDDPAIKLNLAHAHYHLGDTAGAKMNYGKLISSESKKMKSIALQQLGVMSKNAGKLEEALQQLKAAIKADPTNKEAIYNYEVVKKLLEEQKKQEQEQKQDQENKDGEDEQEQQNQDQKKDGEKENQENKDGENQEKSDEENQEKKEQEKKDGEEQESEEEKSQEQMTKEKLEEMGISEEKARQLLEAMRQSEIKYLQHQRRKPTKRPPSGKPDW